MVSKSRLATPARALGVAEAELEDDVSRLQFDAEMVVEHEHEIEVEAQATEKPVFGNSDADRRAGQWPLSSLLVPPSFNKAKVQSQTTLRPPPFRPLSVVRVARMSEPTGVDTVDYVSLPFPSDVLVSLDHTPHQDVGTLSLRRFKNAFVMLQWSLQYTAHAGAGSGADGEPLGELHADTGSTSVYRGVLLSLAEGETLWHCLRQRQQHTCTLADALQSIMSQPVSTQRTAEMPVSLCVGVRLCTINGLVLASQEVVRHHNMAAPQASPAVVVPWNDEAFNLARMCALVYDCFPWFSRDELGALLRALATEDAESPSQHATILADRAAYLNAAASCRRRDRTTFVGTPLQTILMYATEKTWLRSLEVRSRAASHMVRQFGSLSTAFSSLGGSQSSSLPRDLFCRGLTSCGIAMEDVAVLDSEWDTVVGAFVGATGGVGMSKAVFEAWFTEVGVDAGLPPPKLLRTASSDSTGIRHGAPANKALSPPDSPHTTTSNTTPLPSSAGRRPGVVALNRLTESASAARTRVNAGLMARASSASPLQRVQRLTKVKSRVNVGAWAIVAGGGFAESGDRTLRCEGDDTVCLAPTGIALTSGDTYYEVGAAGGAASP